MKSRVLAYLGIFSVLFGSLQAGAAPWPPMTARIEIEAVGKLKLVGVEGNSYVGKQTLEVSIYAGRSKLEIGTVELRASVLYFDPGQGFDAFDPRFLNLKEDQRREAEERVAQERQEALRFAKVNLLTDLVKFEQSGFNFKKLAKPESEEEEKDSLAESISVESVHSVSGEHSELFLKNIMKHNISVRRGQSVTLVLEKGTDRVLEIHTSPQEGPYLPPKMLDVSMMSAKPHHVFLDPKDPTTLVLDKLETAAARLYGVAVDEKTVPLDLKRTVLLATELQVAVKQLHDAIELDVVSEEETAKEQGRAPIFKEESWATREKLNLLKDSLDLLKRAHDKAAGSVCSALLELVPASSRPPKPPMDHAAQ